MTIQEMHEKRLALIAEARKLNDDNPGEKFTAEVSQRWDAINAEADSMKAQIDARIKSDEEAKKRVEKLAAMEREAGGKGHKGSEEKRRELDPELRTADIERNQLLAFQAWALTQSRMELRPEHRAAVEATGLNINQKEIPFGSEVPAYRSYGEPAWSCGGVQRQREVRVGLDVGTAGAGQETIPRGFMAELDKKTLAYGSVRQVCRVVQTATGNTMPWPNVDDTGNVAAILAEATTIGTSVDPTFSSISLLAYKLSSKPIFVSAEILQDSAFNLAQELADMMGMRFGRGENVYFTTGTNSSQPQGIVAAAGTGVTSAVAAAFTADELINLVHSLDPSYRALPSTGFMMHDTAVQYVRKFKDSAGQYLWQPGMIAGVPDRVYGYPVVINQQMEPLVSNVPVTAKKHVLFGAFEKYIVRDAGPTRMYHLVERYRDVDQECFVAFKRVDGRALNTSALKVLLQA